MAFEFLILTDANKRTKWREDYLPVFHGKCWLISFKIYYRRRNINFVVCVGVGCGWVLEGKKIAYKGGFCINKFQAYKKGKNCVGVDDT